MSTTTDAPTPTPTAADAVKADETSPTDAAAPKAPADAPEVNSEAASSPADVPKDDTANAPEAQPNGANGTSAPPPAAGATAATTTATPAAAPMSAAQVATMPPGVSGGPVPAALAAANAPAFAPGAPVVSPQPSASAAADSAVSASLYVGDLHPEITETQLYEIFQALGPVSSIRVCRDLVTRRSLGYAYVNFHNMADAERALETMNYHASPQTKGRPMRIMWKARDPSARKQGQGNIYVKGLDRSIDNKALFDTFSQFGKIMSCKVATDDSGQSLGYGFVHFESAAAAKTATEAVNGMMLADRMVYVGPFLNKRQREEAGQVNKTFTNVYCKNLDDSVCTEEKIRELFKDHGTITSVHVPATPEGKPKGFAFINFESPEMAAKAVQEMDGTEIEGKSIFVGRAQKKAEREAELRNKYEAMKLERMKKLQGVNLYVKNLSDDIDDDKLREEFAPFGTITSCKIMRDEKGESRGFGFVCFTEPDEATKAVTELNGRMIGLKPIYVALAQRKEARRAQLEQQRNMGPVRVPGAGIPPGAMFGQPNPYMFQHAPGMPPQMAPGGPGGMPGGRGNPGFMNPQYIPAMGRGGPVGRGAPVNPGYMAAMGRGQQPMQQINPAAMAQFGMVPQRQPRQRQRNGPMGGPAGPGAMGPGGRGGSQGMGAQQYNNYPRNARGVAGGPPAANGAPNGAAQAAQGQAAGSAAQAPRDQDAPLTIEQLSSASPKEQKQMLGEKLYPLISEKEPALAAKITGMLLEMENSDILHLIDTPEALNEQVDEALSVLRAHQQTAQETPNQAQVV